MEKVFKLDFLNPWVMCLATLGRCNFSRKEYKKPAIGTIFATQSQEITAGEDMERDLTMKHSNF